MIVLDVTFNRRLVRARVGELLQLDLPEDAAAGSRWTLADPVPAELRLIKDKTSSARASDRRLEFRVVREGSFTLSLVCARAWQQTHAASFEVYVQAYETERRVTFDA